MWLVSAAANATPIGACDGARQLVGRTLTATLVDDGDGGSLLPFAADGDRLFAWRDGPWVLSPTGARRLGRSDLDVVWRTWDGRAVVVSTHGVVGELGPRGVVPWLSVGDRLPVGGWVVEGFGALWATGDGVVTWVDAGPENVPNGWFRVTPSGATPLLTTATHDPRTDRPFTGTSSLFLTGGRALFAGGSGADAALFELVDGRVVTVSETFPRDPRGVPGVQRPQQLIALGAAIYLRTWGQLWALEAGRWTLVLADDVAPGRRSTGADPMEVTEAGVVVRTRIDGRCCGLALVDGCEVVDLVGPEPTRLAGVVAVDGYATDLSRGRTLRVMLWGARGDIAYAEVRVPPRP